MTSAKISILAALILAACAPSPEEKRRLNASKAMAARIWTAPQVAEAINVHATLVADFKPGVDILFNSIPLPLGMATYGEYDEFTNVIFDTDKASHRQVFDGMHAYCQVSGRRLVQTHHGVMDVPPTQPQLKAWGFASGLCR